MREQNGKDAKKKICQRYAWKENSFAYNMYVYIFTEMLICFFAKFLESKNTLQLCARPKYKSRGFSKFNSIFCLSDFNNSLILSHLMKQFLSGFLSFVCFFFTKWQQLFFHFLQAFSLLHPTNCNKTQLSIYFERTAKQNKQPPTTTNYEISVFQ